MPIPLGYHGIELTKIWPPRRFDIDSRFLPTLDEAEVVHLHEALPASMEAVRE